MLLSNAGRAAMRMQAAGRLARVMTRVPLLGLSRRSFKARAEPEGQQQQGQQQAGAQIQTQQPREEQGMARREDVRQMPMMPFRRMTDMMDAMQREMDAMTQSMFSDDVGFMMRPFERMLPSLPLASIAAAPMTAAMPVLAVDVEETDKEYKITADVPGFTKDQIHATLSTDGVLTLKGEMKEEQEDKGEKEGGMQRRARRMMQFTRSFRLPQDAEPDKISVSTKHGILNVCIPKAEQPEKKVKELPIMD